LSALGERRTLIIEMQSLDDSALLRHYAESQSNEAFSALVRRYVNLVYSVALRQAGNPHQAEEIAQAVFIILARKASQLRHEKALSSWLFQTTRLTARNFLRSEARRQRREQEAYMESTSKEPAADVWPQLAHLLDPAVESLGEQDRRAVMLRFYEGRNLREVGLALGTSEAAAEKRVHRALEKIRKMFGQRGVSISVAAIVGVAAANSVQAAPAGLAASISATALTQAAAGGISTLTLIKGALKIMVWTKAKITVAATVSVLLVAGTTTVTVIEIAHSDERIWRTPNLAGDVFQKAAPRVTILPTKYPRTGNAIGGTGYRWIGINRSLAQIVGYAYDWPYARIVFDTGNPKVGYDMIANLPQGSTTALQAELKRKLGLTTHPETRDMEALVLRVSRANAPGLKPPTDGRCSDPWGHFTCHNQTVATAHPSDFSLALELELIFGKPVIDQTGLTQRYDIDLQWTDDAGWLGRQADPDHPALKQALLDQLGLELEPATLPIELLVVRQTKA
jgi:uncharacterized protein (TIGR03435 family)